MIVRVPNKAGLESAFENQQSFSDAQRAFAMSHPHLAYYIIGRRRFTEAERLAIFTRDNGRCYHCGEKLDFTLFHIDHLTAIANGGSDEFDNLCASCPPCNLRKGAS